MSRIAGYAFGRVTVDGREETRDVIVLPDRVVRDWRRRDGHSLVMADLAGVAGEQALDGGGDVGEAAPAVCRDQHVRCRAAAVEAAGSSA